MSFFLSSKSRKGGVRLIDIGNGLVMNNRRTVRVLKRAAYAWENRLLAFSTMVPPEIEHMEDGIESGTREHAMGVFLAGYFSRSGKLADDVIPKAYRLLVERPELADPRQMKENFSAEDREYIAELIAFAKRDPKRIDHYIITLKTLRDKYDGDPRNIFLTLPRVNSLMKARKLLVDRLSSKGFPGIGHKIAQLIVIWFQDTEWPEITDHPEYSIKWEWIRKIPAFPVDIWMMRLVRQFDLVVEWKTDHRDRVSKLIAEFFSEVCYRHKISRSMAAQGLWHAGSRLCNRSRQKSDVKKSVHCKTRCPFYDFCIGVMQTDKDLRGRGSIGWGTHLKKHNRVFPQSEISGLVIPDNDGTVHPIRKTPKSVTKEEQEQSLPLFL